MPTRIDRCDLGRRAEGAGCNRPKWAEDAGTAAGDAPPPPRCAHLEHPSQVVLVSASTSSSSSSTSSGASLSPSLFSCASLGGSAARPARAFAFAFAAPDFAEARPLPATDNCSGVGLGGASASSGAACPERAPRAPFFATGFAEAAGLAGALFEVLAFLPLAPPSAFAFATRFVPRLAS